MFLHFSITTFTFSLCSLNFATFVSSIQIPIRFLKLFSPFSSISTPSEIQPVICCSVDLTSFSFEPSIFAPKSTSMKFEPSMVAIQWLDYLNERWERRSHWRWEKHKKGGLNCVFKNVSFLRKLALFSGFRVWWSSDSNQSSESQQRNKNKCKKERRHKQFYTGSFHKPEVVLSPLHFQGEFH